jgi:ferredoxin--NADP+ reductase
VEEVIAIARRGPAEVKFTRTELEYVVGNLDIPAYQAEIERVSPLMRSLGQDPNKPLELVQAALQRAAVTGSDSRFQLRFLGSPVKILGDSHQRVVGLEIENTTLVENGGEIRAKGLGVFQTLMVDNVIFAIGDRVDATFGLPVKGNEFVKNPNPRFPVEDISYEVFDPETNQPLERIFVAGWARQASTGLVGLAKKDGVNGARAILQYLETQPDGNPSALQLLESRMAGLNKPVVCKEDLARLAVVEQQKAARNGLEEFKFASNHEMLEAMGMAVLHG